MTTPFYQPNQAEATAPAPQEDAMRPNKIDTHEYRFVFNSCGVGMVSYRLVVRPLLLSFASKVPFTHSFCLRFL
jgi:hypothetical protein